MAAPKCRSASTQWAPSRRAPRSFGAECRQPHPDAHGARRPAPIRPSPILRHGQRVTPLTVASPHAADALADVGLPSAEGHLLARGHPETMPPIAFFATTASNNPLAATIVMGFRQTCRPGLLQQPDAGLSPSRCMCRRQDARRRRGAFLDALNRASREADLTQSFTTVSTTVVPTPLSRQAARSRPDLLPMTLTMCVAGPDQSLHTAMTSICAHRACEGVHPRPGERSVFTAARHFTLTSVPSGDVKCARRAHRPPIAAGFYFPEMVMDSTIKPRYRQHAHGLPGSDGQAIGPCLRDPRPSICQDCRRHPDQGQSDTVPTSSARR